jgi:hypothetical protein
LSHATHVGESLDQRYLEFADKTAGVFRRFPEIEPLRYFVFREVFVQPRSPGLGETAKHWVRPFLRSGRTSEVRRATVSMWVEGGRGIIRDTLMPVFRELRRHEIGVQLVSFDGPQGLPDQTVHFHYPAASWAPRWAGEAWDSLCDVEPKMRTPGLRRSFLYACADLASLLAEMDRVLEAMRPRLVVTASTQMIGGSALCVSARRHRIRTVLLQHGIVQPFYTPVTADMMVTWGRSSSDTLERLGIEGRRLIALGSPRHDSMGTSRTGTAKQAVVQALSLKEGRIFVFFSNGNDLLRNGAAPRESARWLNTLAERFRDRLHVIVRLHPNEDGSLYRGYERLVITKTRPTFEELMDGCDFVGSLCSTAMYEALLYRKPVWQFYADGWPDLADNWKSGLASRIASEEELLEVVDRILSEDAPAPGMIEDLQAVFVNHGRAAAAVTNFILSQLHPEALS